MKEFLSIADDVELGKDVRLSRFINLYGCKIGEGSRVGAFVEIQKNASVGRMCKVSSHTFICEGVHIDDYCFIGHGVMFVNDNRPRAVTPTGQPEADEDWADRFVETHVEQHVSIGTNATILGGLRIGRGSLIGAGSVVTRNVPPGEIWAGNPARMIGKVGNP